MAIPFKKLGYKLNPVTRDIETPQVFLVNKKLKKIGELYPVEDFNITINEVNQPDEVSFTYYKETNGEKSPHFDKLTDLCVIQVGNYGFFEIASSKSESTSVVKKITAQSLGIAELSQINVTLDVNTDEDFKTNSNENTVFYRGIDVNNGEDDKKRKKELSLLDRILSYAPHYKVGDVDPTLRNIQRTFSWSDTDVMSALNDVATEVNCVFDIRVTINENGDAERIVNAYDMQYCQHCWDNLDEQSRKTNDTYTFRNIVNGVCQNCGSSKFINDIGQDTNIFISTENLTDEIDIQGDKDSIKNCFKIVGGDDTITATVQGLNMSANNRIMMFSDEQKKLMSPELVAKLEAYDRDYAGNSVDYEKLLEIQYDLYDMVLYLKSGKMPISEEEITETDEALYSVISQITKYYNNRFYISTYKNYGYAATRTAINNMFTTFMPKGYSFNIDVDGITQTSGYNSSTQYKWWGTIKIYNTGNRDDYYTLHVNQTGSTTITQGKSEMSFEFSDRTKQNTISNFSVIFNFADKNQTDYMNYIKQYTSYLLSEVDLEYENEKAREWDQYCYNRLESFYDGFNTCIEEIDRMNDEILAINDEEIDSVDDETDLLTPIKENYRSIQNDIHEQMLVLRDQIFALSSYLGEYSSDFLDANGNPHHTFKKYSGVSEVMSHIINSKYTGGYAVKSDKTSDTAKFIPNEFIGTKPCKCKKCSSTNVAVSTKGNVCLNCDSTDIYTYYDVMKDIVDSYNANNLTNPNSSVADLRSKIQSKFDIETYFNDKNLYNELFSFIREDVYRNDNYKSDGLTNSQLISHARELMAKARQELSKACVTQYTVTAPVSAVAGQTEFEYKGITVNDDYSGFMLNNYVRVRIEDEVYKMRIASIQLSFPIQDKINVTFTNVSHYANGAMSDIASIVEGAASMSSSFNYVATQAEKGEEANIQFNVIKNEGLNAALMAVKGGRDQDVVIDNHGILLRKKIPEIDDYSDYQMKLINRNIVFTKDKWKHAKMAIGLGTYNNMPVYGVWADVLVGELIVGKDLLIRNENSSVEIGETGIVIKNGSTIVTKIKTDGDAEFHGTIYAKEGEFNGTITAKNGNIGSWDIGNNYIRQTNLSKSSYIMNGSISRDSTNDTGTRIADGEIMQGGQDGDNHKLAWIHNGAIDLTRQPYDDTKYRNVITSDIIQMIKNNKIWYDINGVDREIFIKASSISLCNKSYLDDKIWLYADGQYEEISVHGKVMIDGDLSVYGTLYAPDGAVSTSDRRYKKDIQEVSENEVDFILGLSAKKFKLINGTSDRYHYGFIAQDVEQTMNDTIGDVGLLVKSESISSDDQDYVPVDFSNKKTFQYGLRYDEFIAPIIKTIQYLNDRVSNLENKLKLIRGGD